MEDLRRRWEAHRSAAFPGEARGRAIAGVDLVLVDSYAAGAIQTFLATGALDAGRTDALKGAVDVLDKGMSSLAGDTAVYFGELLALGQAVLTSARPV